MSNGMVLNLMAQGLLHKAVDGVRNMTNNFINLFANIEPVTVALVWKGLLVGSIFFLLTLALVQYYFEYGSYKGTLPKTQECDCEECSKENMDENSESNDEVSESSGNEAAMNTDK